MDENQTKGTHDMKLTFGPWRRLRALQLQYGTLATQHEAQSKALKEWEISYRKMGEKFERQVEGLRKSGISLANDYNTAIERLKTCEAVRNACEEMPALGKAALADALAGVDPENRLWRALLTVLRGQEEQEAEYALRPGLTSEERHYYAGRAASLLEMRFGLVRKQQELAGAVDRTEAMPPGAWTTVGAKQEANLNPEI
jgi:hypothetical protein